MNKPEEFVYLDHAATTPVHPEVIKAMLPYFSEKSGNPSSIHRLGQASLRALDEARRDVAQALGAREDEIVFTGCGSESDNLALRGVAFASRHRGNHIITSAIEHHAISHTCQQLQDHFGFRVTVLPVDQYGMVDPDDVQRAITDQTVLISVMTANNEVGTIQPIAEIGAIARQAGVPFHTDAVQVGAYLSLDVDELGVDLLSLSAHKFYGPKGVGVLYVRQGTPMLSVLTGGGQEDGRRAGTENVPGIVGLATALTIAQRDRQASNQRIAALRDRLTEAVLDRIPGARLTGHPSQRMPNHASFAIDGVVGDGLVMALDMYGICASSGSACAAGASEPSHVLLAMGVPEDLALGSLRLTLGHATTASEINYALQVLPQVVGRLRASC